MWLVEQKTQTSKEVQLKIQFHLTYIVSVYSMILFGLGKYVKKSNCDVQYKILVIECTDISELGNICSHMAVRLHWLQ